MRSRLVTGLLGLAFATSGCSVSFHSSPAAKPIVYLMPVGPVAESTLEAATAELATFDVRPVTVAPVAVDDTIGDRDRRQLVSEKIAARAASEAVARKLEPGAVIFAVTPYDIYTARLAHQRFAFGHRDPNGTIAVMSTARFDPVNFDEPPDPALLERRVRKYVARNATILVLKRAVKDDPSCITDSSLDSLAELDTLSTNRC